MAFAFNFLSYLSASDRKISDYEAAFIKDYLSNDMTPAKLSEYIQENNTYSTAFEGTVPETLKNVMDKDNAVYEEDNEERICCHFGGDNFHQWNTI